VDFFLAGVNRDIDYCEAGRKVKGLNTEDTEERRVTRDFRSIRATASRARPAGNRVDKILIPPGVGTVSDGERLAMRLGRKRGGAHIRDPNLDGPHAQAAQALAVRLDLVAGGFGAGL